MSSIVRRITNRACSHIVVVSGNFYYVDTAHVKLAKHDSYYELMVFPYDNETDKVNWDNPVYTERFTSYKEAEERHFYVIMHLENFV